MKKDAVILYAKWPELGKTKTRIQKETSNQDFALNLSRAFLEDLVDNICTENNEYDVIVAANTNEELANFKEHFGLEGFLTNSNKQDRLEAQSEKVGQSFEKVLAKYEKAVLIPSDIPYLTKEDVSYFLGKIETNNIVIGPEHNGGVYAIGMSRPYTNIFLNVPWSSQMTAKVLEKNSLEAHLVVQKLKVRSDFNTMQEIINNKNMISAHCRKTYKLLEKEGYTKNKEDFLVNYDNLAICIPVVSVIVEKKENNETMILLQTRYKPQMDPYNTGKLEIPNGLIGKKEDARDAALRELKEETGISAILSGDKTSHTHYSTEERVSGYTPYMISQQLVGGRSYISTGFIAKYQGGELRENIGETRNPRWYSKSDLRKIMLEDPTKIFGLNIPILEKYLEQNVHN